uniref:Uncharacterized protein n=1 Tax=Trichogramma kaykai TaxID=54128 RepID=A0ABD2X4B4_9HYME
MSGTKVIYTDVTNRYFDQLRLKSDGFLEHVNFPIKFSIMMRFSENFHFSRENHHQTCQAKCLELRGMEKVVFEAYF